METIELAAYWVPSKIFGRVYLINGKNDHVEYWVHWDDEYEPRQFPYDEQDIAAGELIIGKREVLETLFGHKKTSL